MNYGQLKTAVLATRGDASDTRAGDWVNEAYRRIWDASQDWTFKRDILRPATTAFGSNYLTFSPSYTLLGDVLNVYDDYGTPLDRLEQREFDPLYLAGQLSSTRGRPSAYEVLNRLPISTAIVLYPTADATYTFNVEGTLRLVHLDNGGATVLGAMTADTDKPYFDSEWHYTLVLGATALGLKMENDPSYGGVQDEYMASLASMREALVDSRGLQYGD